MEHDQIIAAVLRGLEQGGPSANVLRGYVDEDSIDMILAVAEPLILAVAEPLIRADERKQICRAEGHNAADVTTIGQAERHLLCKRCGEAWTEPFACTCYVVGDEVDCPATEHRKHLWADTYSECVIEGCPSSGADPSSWPHDLSLTRGTE